MPIFKQYKHDSGYYIRAWTPETGNINYKIKREGDPIVEGYGLSHEDEISWDVIKSLKLLRLIYTDGSGILEVGDFEPDPNQLEETSLTEPQAKELLATIQEHHDLSQNQLETICSILGIEAPQYGIDRLGDNLKEKVNSLVSEQRIPIGITLEEPTASELVVSTSTRRLQGDNDNSIGARVILASFPENSAGQPTHANFAGHTITVSPDNGICGWEMGFTGEKSWESKSEMILQMGNLVSVAVETLNEVGIDPGDPEGSFDPDLRDFADMSF
ncbi:hypothetical protein [Halococcus sediminicola]|uniref:hypothetical protein n=1 Tax=Halococcus sediminicola TaxID=1264579 RepID=UPI00067914B2|nr:hypothetical protein [Halococcus sediminicola]